MIRPAIDVALRKESVDRNLMTSLLVSMSYLSLSARRAWIEIVYPGTWSGSILVALRKESVDRNARKIRFVAPDVSSLSARRAWIEIIAPGVSVFRGWSLSARRAWIEIAERPVESRSNIVALRKESVDRNYRLYH